MAGITLTIEVDDKGTVKVKQFGDEAKKAFDQMKKGPEDAKGSLESLSSSFMGTIAQVTAFAASVYGAYETVKSFISAAAEAEQVESRMAFQVNAAGIKYGDVKLAIDAYAHSIQDTTRFSTVAAEQGIGKMMQYTDNLKQAMDGVTLAMNMHIQSGKDLEFCYRAVGMVMNGEVDILGRMLTEFKHLGAGLDENSTKAEKTEAGMKRLQELYGGAGANDLNTYTAQVERLGNQWTEFEATLGQLLLPTALKVTEGLRNMAKAAELGAGGGSQMEQLEKQIRDLEAAREAIEAEPLALSTNVEALRAQAVLDIREDIRKKEQQCLDLIQAISVAEEKSAVAGGMRQAQEDLKVYSDWLKKTTEQEKPLFDPLIDSYTKLGITSIDAMNKQKIAVTDALAYVKAAVEAGRATWQDYVEALSKANDILTKMKPKDAADQLHDLDVEYQKRVSTILLEDPQREQKMSALTNWWSDELAKIKPPVTTLDIGPLELAVNKGIGDLDRLIAYYKDNPVKIYTDTSQLDELRSQAGVSSAVGPGYEYGGSGPQSEVPSFQTGAMNIPKDMLAWLHAGETVVPAGFDVSTLIASLQGFIQLSQLSADYKKMQDQMAQLQDFIPGIGRAIAMSTEGYIGASGGIGPPQSLIARANQAISDLQSKMSMNQMSMMLQMLQMVPSYQSGTDYVPKTGLALLHKGERVTPSNQISMGGVTIGPLHISGSGDPKETANQVVKALKYYLSGELRDLIKH